MYFFAPYMDRIVTVYTRETSDKPRRKLKGGFKYTLNGGVWSPLYTIHIHIIYTL